MKVQKRTGEIIPLSFDKILQRISKLVNSEEFRNLDIDPSELTQSIIANIYDGIKTCEIDDISARLSIGKNINHPDYGTLAARISVSNLQKKCPKKFSDCIELLGDFINENVSKVVKDNKEIIDSYIIHSNDYNYDFFGLKTLERAYLLKKDGEIVETPQYLLMRVALGLHNSSGEKNLSAALETYNLTSNLLFTHASPTLFNSGTKRQQNSSCFLMGLEDSITGIMKGVSDCAQISKFAGGIGIHASEIRGKNSVIKGTNGRTDSIVKMLKIFNETARFANQGSKRNGSFAIYLEPHHPDISDFLEMRKNTGDENNRARDLFYALWVSDKFMEHVENDLDWYLLSADECPGLTDAVGSEYSDLYDDYVSKGLFREKVKARDVWNKMIVSQIETGMPYVCYKDSVNRKNNQSNLGTIKSSNLCAEVNLYSEPSKGEVASCNIATVSLPKFVEFDLNTNKKFFNFEKLGKIVEVIVVNLNRVIDVNFYPTSETKQSNLNHRPIIIGSQGLSNAFFELDLDYESNEASLLNYKIFETIQYYSLKKSCELSETLGPYCSFIGSPASKGILQHNMWGISNNDELLSYDWESLKDKIVKYGLRNSLVTGSPPTASTSQILGNYESFEPVTSNLLLRTTLSGDFPVVNGYLIRDLIKLNLWNPEMKNEIIKNRGSVQSISSIPEKIRKIYKTVWEISQKTVINMSRDRGYFTDNSQSLNIFMTNPSIAKISSMLFYGYKQGLKTGLYYLRTRSIANAQQFTVSEASEAKAKAKAGAGVLQTKASEASEAGAKASEASEASEAEAENEKAKLYCSIKNKDNCEACSG